MKLKVQMFNRDTQHETSNIGELRDLKRCIEKTLAREFPRYDYKIRIYGEVVIPQDQENC
jgi:hypothetical protein